MVGIILSCPKCKSENIIKNGYPRGGKNWGGKQQFICKQCGKYFYNNSEKEYPKTNIPFEIIAHLLYLHKRSPTLNRNFRKFRGMVNFRLYCLQQIDDDSKIARQTIHYWIDHYSNRLENLISVEETFEYCKPLDIGERLSSFKIYESPVVKKKGHINKLKAEYKKSGYKILLKMFGLDEDYFEKKSNQHEKNTK